MKKSYLSLLVVSSFLMMISCSLKHDYNVISPDGNIMATLHFDRAEGTVTYAVQSHETEIISASLVGIQTDRGDFSTGMKLKGQEARTIDETYQLPLGKASAYTNRANEQVLTLKKGDQEMDLLFRVYDDGIAFSYQIPGEGAIVFDGETSVINLAGSDITCYGQKHPNRYGYEGSLGPVDSESISNPVLVHIHDRNHFVLMGQAATYGHYIQPHFDRSGSSFAYRYPLDQEKIGPVQATLPFQSPWRMVIISPQNPGKIVESYLVENLNPPTVSEFLNADGSVKAWIRPGRVMWDFIAKDGDKPRMWIDAVAEMGWEYYMADAGFARRWGGEDSVKQVVSYAVQKGVDVIGWAHTREFNTRERAAETMKRYADWGLKGAKIDFFDHNTLSENPREWRDYEDTQESLQMRDWIFDLAIENRFLLELHGNTIPTGERRRYPNLMTLEGVDGMERRTKPAANDLTIPFVRNVMGPVSYTVVHFERSPGTHAYQLAMPVIYEAGLMIYAEHGEKLLEWEGRELIASLPSAWDETRFLEGLPASHIALARRKGDVWYVAGMTDQARTLDIPLNFLTEGKNYQALLFSDDAPVTMKRELIPLKNGDTLSVQLLERGGFAARIMVAD